MIRKILERMAGLNDQALPLEIQALVMETKLLFLTRDVQRTTAEVDARIEATRKRVNSSEVLRNKAKDQRQTTKGR